MQPWLWGEGLVPFMVEVAAVVWPVSVGGAIPLVRWVHQVGRESGCLNVQSIWPLLVRLRAHQAASPRWCGRLDGPAHAEDDSGLLPVAGCLGSVVLQVCLAGLVDVTLPQKDRPRLSVWRRHRFSSRKPGLDHKSLRKGSPAYMWITPYD